MSKLRTATASVIAPIGVILMFFISGYIFTWVANIIVNIPLIRWVANFTVARFGWIVLLSGLCAGYTYSFGNFLISVIGKKSRAAYIAAGTIVILISIVYAVFSIMAHSFNALNLALGGVRICLFSNGFKY